jgi:hypothetical protein
MPRVKAIALVFALCGIAACSSRKSAELLDPPIITSATYQHALYNGEAQSIDARAAKKNAPLIVTYYASEADYDADRNGFAEAPKRSGLVLCAYTATPGQGLQTGPGHQG